MKFNGHICLILSLIFIPKAFAGDDPFSDFGSFDENKAKWTINGYIEYREQSSVEQDEDYRKYELKSNIDFKYGRTDLFVKGDVNLYNILEKGSGYKNNTNALNNDNKLNRNLSCSSKNTDFNFRELYINLNKGNLRFRAGNQVYHWGTADVINPTSYFNPYDLRNLIFKDEDSELKIGVPSFSAEYFRGSDSFEVVIVPFHIPSKVPVSKSYWGLDYKEGPFPIFLEKEEEIDADISGAGVGLKYYKNIQGFDVQFSLYRGPQKLPVFIPYKTESIPGDTVYTVVKPRVRPFTAAGIAVSNTYNRFVFQFEGVYSPDKSGVCKKNLKTEPIKTILPFNSERGEFYSFSAGFNFFYPFSPGKEGVFTIEWSKSGFFDDNLEDPYFSDLICLKISEKLFSKKLETSIAGIINSSDSFYSILPSLKYSVTNNILSEIRYTFIKAPEESVFNGYNNNDFIEWRIRYEF